MTDDTKKNAFITGASRGLGLALTKQFIRNQWDVFSLVRDKKVGVRLKEIGTERCFPIVSDVSMDHVQDDIREVLNASGSIDVLINNAGIGGNSPHIAKTTTDEALSLFNVHCLGALRVTQAVLPFMKNDGLIINISSRFGSIRKMASGELDGIPCSYSYRIAKAAQNMLTQCMCREFKHEKIRICSINPGRLKTDTASPDADKTPQEAAEQLFGMLKDIEHGKFYSLFEGEIEW